MASKAEQCKAITDSRHLPRCYRCGGWGAFMVDAQVIINGQTIPLKKWYVRCTCGRMPKATMTRKMALQTEKLRRLRDVYARKKW